MIDDIVYEHSCDDCGFIEYAQKLGSQYCKRCNSDKITSYAISKYCGDFSFRKYQDMAKQTAIYSDKIVYPALGLAGESGEVCEKIKKIIRDKKVTIDGVCSPKTEDEFDVRESIKKEIGDVLWYCANLCSDLGVSLEDVAKLNIQKLFSRKERNVLTGSGDDR